MRQAGIAVTVGHAPENLPEGAEVIISTAIPEENTELAAAREKNLAVRHRSDLLADLCSSRQKALNLQPRMRQARSPPRVVTRRYLI